MSRFEKLIECLEKTTFYTDPASSSFHNVYVGGLSSHSYDLFNNLTFLSKNAYHVWSDPESPRIIALCHDVCKIGAYLPNGNGGYRFNPNHPKGHGDLSAKMAKEWIDLTPEEEACIRWHMGPFVGPEEWNDYSAATMQFPIIHLVHLADYLAAQHEGKYIPSIFTKKVYEEAV